MNVEDKIAQIIMAKMNSDFSDSTEYSQSTPTEITNVYLDLLLKYLKDNTVGILAYVGTITETGTPDPIVTDTIKIKITDNFTRYTPPSVSPETGDVHYNAWINHLMTNIYNNVFVYSGNYIKEPPVPTKFFNDTLPSMTVPRSTVKAAFDNDCDENGRVKDNVDVAMDCHKALIKAIINILISSIGRVYNSTNLADTSTGICTITTINII